MPKFTDLPATELLFKNKLELEKQHLRQLFAKDPQRAERFSVRLEDP